MVKETQDAENDQTCDHDGSVRSTRASRRKLQAWYAIESRSVTETCKDGYLSLKRRQILQSSQHHRRRILLSMVGSEEGFYFDSTVERFAANSYQKRSNSALIYNEVRAQALFRSITTTVLQAEYYPQHRQRHVRSFQALPSFLLFSFFIV